MANFLNFLGGAGKGAADAFLQSELMRIKQGQDLSGNLAALSMKQMFNEADPSTQLERQLLQAKIAYLLGKVGGGGSGDGTGLYPKGITGELKNIYAIVDGAAVGQGKKIDKTTRDIAARKIWEIMKFMPRTTQDAMSAQQLGIQGGGYIPDLSGILDFSKFGTNSSSVTATPLPFNKPGSFNKMDILRDAKNAIMQGADRDAVKNKMKTLGLIDDDFSGL